MRYVNVNVNVNVHNLLAISESDFNNSGEPGTQAKGVNHPLTPLRQLHASHRASSCPMRGGHVRLFSTPRAHAAREHRWRHIVNVNVSNVLAISI